MNWEYKFKDLQEEVRKLEEKANSLTEAYAEAEDFTLRFLKCCSKHHIKLVSIGKRQNLSKAQKTFLLVAVEVFLQMAEAVTDGLPFGEL